MNFAALRRTGFKGATLASISVGAFILTWNGARTSAQLAQNPIVLENQQAGSDGWLWSKLGDDVSGQIKGYPSATSVDQNDTITFHISVTPAQAYTIDFYRFGWYGGKGARLRLHVGPLDGVQQPACTPDSQTGLIACNWAPAYTLTVPADWTSGVYGALLTNAAGYQNYVIFVVKDGRRAPLLYQQSVATDEAYNNYPDDGRTGKSLYGFNSYGSPTVGGTPGAVKVSFDRPMATSGIGVFFNWELNFIRWAERSGYDMTYTTDIDTHVNGAELQNHKGFLSVGHDEYWTKEMYDAAEAARNNGVNLAFFGGNAVYTQVRYESSAAGVPNRVMVCYRSYPWAPIDPVQGPTTTTEFRQPPVNRPEQTLVGVQYSVTHPNFDYVVTNSSHWVYAGTGFKDGDVVPGIVGYEADSLMPNFAPPNALTQTLLSQSPYDDNGVTKYTNSSIYQAPSGAWVFAAGTMSWTWALDYVPGPYRHFVVDARIQQATANVLNAFLNGPPSSAVPTISGLTPASGPVGSSVVIGGTNFTGASGVRFNGVPAVYTVTSGSTIQTTVPAGATTGPVTVTTFGGTATSPTNFTVANPPTVASFDPTIGGAGFTVNITGTNFLGASSVSFNGAAATFTVGSDTTIQATVPAGASTGPISVTTPGGTGTSSGSFTFLSPPTITSMTPTSGSQGAGVTITGTNFINVVSVRFNGTQAGFSVQSPTSILAAVPVGATTGPVTVVAAGGSVTSAANFLIVPLINSFTPTSGRPGSSVTISGTTFTGATAVRFNGTAATFTVTSATTIQATVPATAGTGPISVTTAGATGSSAAVFTVRETLTVAKTGIFGGTVTSSPAGINCGSTCSGDFNYGTVVSLTPAPALLSFFNNWTGCDSVSGTTCIVTMNATKTVTANFIP